MEITLAKALLEMNETDLIVLLTKLRVSSPETFDTLKEYIEDHL